MRVYGTKKPRLDKLLARRDQRVQIMTARGEVPNMPPSHARNRGDILREYLIFGAQEVPRRKALRRELRLRLAVAINICPTVGRKLASRLAWTMPFELLTPVLLQDQETGAINHWVMN